MSDNYITKEEVLSFVEEMEKRVHGDDLIAKSVLATTKCVKDFVMYMPPEDVQPVVHGEWIKKRDSDLYYCSECDLPSMHKWAFCEQCGAKMDKRKGADDEKEKTV